MSDGYQVTSDGDQVISDGFQVTFDGYIKLRLTGFKSLLT